MPSRSLATPLGVQILNIMPQKCSHPDLHVAPHTPPSSEAPRARLQASSSILICKLVAEGLLQNSKPDGNDRPGTGACR